MWLCALSLLWIVPVLTYRWARRVRISRAFCAAGIALGAIASPASLGTFGLYWLAGEFGLIALPLLLVGGLGFLSTCLHEPPGLYLATTLGLFRPEEAASAQRMISIESINAVIWAIVYGLIGFAMDSFTRRRIRYSVPPNEPTEGTASA